MLPVAVVQDLTTAVLPFTDGQIQQYLEKMVAVRCAARPRWNDARGRSTRCTSTVCPVCES